MIIPIDFSSPLYDESIALRDLVLRKPLGLSFFAEDLAQEWNQHHIAYIDSNSEIKGILVLKQLDGRILKMRQVAVHPDYQGQGIGSKLVGYSEEHADRLGAIRIELNAREIAIPFYESLQYHKVGSMFTEVGIPHYKMEKEI